MKYKIELLSLIDLNDNQKAIAIALVKNEMNVYETAKQLNINSQIIRQLYHVIIEKTSLVLWKKYDLNAERIAEKIGTTNRHMIINFLKPYGYDYRKYQIKSVKDRTKNRQDEFKLFLEKHKPDLNHLDDFIEENRGHLSYVDAKKIIYDQYPNLRKQAYHKVLPLSERRKQALENNTKLRKPFIDGMKLDFPNGNAIQLWALQCGDIEKAYRSRTLNSNELVEIKTKYKQGYTINELAEQLGVSFAKVKKAIVKMKILNEGDSYRCQRRRKKAEQSLSKISTQAKKRQQQQMAERKHAHAIIPKQYLDQIPTWAYEYVSKQPQLLWFEKMAAISHDLNKVCELFELAKQNIGHKITISDLDVIFPPVSSVKNMSTCIYKNWSNSDRIKALTGGKSRQEIQVETLLTQLNVSYQRNAHIIKHTKNNEIDFYLPQQHLGIEISPIRTHNSNRYPHNSNQVMPPKERSYHATKQRLCEKQGIKLITLFERDLEPSFFKERITPRLKRMIIGKPEKIYYARQTIIEPIDRSIAKKFLERWHDDGNTPAKYRYAIKEKNTNEILGVATFAKPQIIKYKHMNLLELKRLAWRADVQVRYGISKIISRAKKDLSNEFDGLVTFSNNNIGWGLGYQKAGFTLVKRTAPQMKFINENHPEDSYSWSIATSWGAKSGVLARIFGPQKLTNEQARELVETKLPHRADNGKGYSVQYDCGNKVWIQKWN